MSISKGTIVRTISLVIVIINMILKKCGVDVINVSESQILTAVEMIIELAVIIVAFWKNNSYSQNAIKADEFLKNLKEMDIDADEDFAGEIIEGDDE